MSNENENEMPKEDAEEVGAILGFLAIISEAKGPVVVATACANHLVRVVCFLPREAREGAIEALLRDIRTAVGEQEAHERAEAH